MTGKIKKNFPLIIFTLLSSSLLIVWVSLDKSPLVGDAASYATDSINFYRSINKQDKVLYNYIHLNGRRKAPLINLLPIPFFYLFGIGKISLFLPNIIIFTLMIPSFYFLVRKLYSHRVAVMAVTTLTTSPLIYGLSRQLYPDFQIAAFSIFWFYSLIKTEYFKKRHWNLILGIITGLGLLAKISFAYVIFFPSLYILFRRLLEGKKQNLKTFILDVTFILVPTFLLTFHYYLPNLKILLWQMKRAGFGPPSYVTSLGPVLSPQTIFSYWNRIISYGISTYYLTLFVISFIWVFLNKKRHPNLNLLILIWFLIPFLLQTFGGAKDLRYFAPALPPISIIFALYFASILKKSKYTFLHLILFFIFPMLFFINTSYSIPFSLPRLQVGSFLVLDTPLIYPENIVAIKPSDFNWPHQQIINDLKSLNKKRVILLVQSNYFSIYNLMYFATLNNFPLESINESNLSDSFVTPNFESAEEKVQNADALLTQIGPLTDSSKNIYGQIITNRLLEGRYNFNLYKKYPLPSDSEALLFIKNP